VVAVALADAAGIRVPSDDDQRISGRYRNVLQPRGFRDEPRLVFHGGRTARGALCLYRAATTDEARTLRRGRAGGTGDVVFFDHYLPWHALDVKHAGGRARGGR
jgi:hypothetical protein